MVGKYRKKPVVIDAVAWTGDNYQEIKEFVGNGGQIALDVIKTHLIVMTLEGNMFASKGDYIIRGVKGEFYPCKPDIFEKTYEPYIDVSVPVDE